MNHAYIIESSFSSKPISIAMSPYREKFKSHEFTTIGSTEQKRIKLFDLSKVAVRPVKEIQERNNGSRWPFCCFFI
jgi:hypothetical protein